MGLKKKMTQRKSKSSLHSIKIDKEELKQELIKIRKRQKKIKEENKIKVENTMNLIRNILNSENIEDLSFKCNLKLKCKNKKELNFMISLK